MSERTDERTSDAEDVDVSEVLDDFGSGGGDVESGDVGFNDDELGVDVEALTGEPDASASRSANASASARGSESSAGFLSRLRPSFPSVPNPLAALPSGRSVLLSFAVVLLSMGVLTSIPVLGMVPLLWAVGVFAGAFLLGTASGKARYFELFLAGAVSGSSLVIGDFFRIALLSGIGLVPLVAAGAGIGAVAGLLGHYFGRDFRKGLTMDVE